MLCIKRLAPHKLNLVRRQLLSFIIKYGERRITREATQWLATVAERELEKAGSAILLAIDGQRLVGILAAVHYGRSISFAVVSPTDRGQGIGQSLINEFIHWAGHFTCKVSANNYPSLRTCMKAGLVIDQLWKGKRGQLIFRLVTPNLLPAHPANSKLASSDSLQTLTPHHRQVLKDEDATVGNHDVILEQS